jgi:hypothetical protein
MTRATMAGGTVATMLVLLAVALGYRALDRDSRPAAAGAPAIAAPTAPTARSSPATPSSGAPAARADQGFLYGRITAADGVTYEGRLRFGGKQEAFWGDTFDGAKRENLWLAQVPPELRPRETRTIGLFGINLIHREVEADVGRLLVVHFGEVARIERNGRDIQVTLKSGAVYHIDRWGASDFDDGVKVWDNDRGEVTLDSLKIHSIDLLPTPTLDALPRRLHGTVRTSQGDFTGFVVWDREECVGSDELDGSTADGELHLHFDTIRSIVRRSDSSLVTLLDGREIELSGTNDVDHNNRGVYVHDPRYGRVLIAWGAFERVDFTPGESGPSYADFPPGSPLIGTVTTRAGVRLTGRLVYDLDESETIEMFDASYRGVNYAIPFGLVASIEMPGGADLARVTLHSGEALQVERDGDLSDKNAGMLIFVDGRERPEYLRWTDVEKVSFDPPPAMDSPLRDW